MLVDNVVYYWEVDASCSHIFIAVFASHLKKVIEVNYCLVFCSNMIKTYQTKMIYYIKKLVYLRYYVCKTEQATSEPNLSSAKVDEPRFAREMVDRSVCNLQMVSIHMPDALI